MLRIGSRPGCPTCTIELELIATITDSETTARLGQQMMLTADSRGRLYGTDLTVAQGQILVFASDGRYLESWGRNGEGPGEYRVALSPFFGTGDTAYVADLVLRRLTRLDPSGTYIDNRPLPGSPRQIIPIAEGFLLTGLIRTADRTGRPLHIANMDGDVVRSFGSDSLLRSESRRTVAYSPPGHVWSAQANQFFIERWSLDGRKELSIERQAAWFENWVSYEGPPTAVRPPTSVHALWEDDQKRLWVAVSVPDANWRRASGVRPGAEVAIPRASTHEIYDTMIEVIDPVTGTVIAARRFPRNLQSMGNGQPFVTYHEDDVGLPTYRVWRFRLNDPR